MQPLQYRNLPNISDVNPISKEDKDCFIAVREVLKKHGLLDRYGLCLLHTHFNLDVDEVMAETCDDASRTLTIKPTKKSKVGHGQTIETMWRLDTMEA